MHIYMMLKLNMRRTPRYSIGDDLNPKTYHSRSMAGPWPLAPHHDHLQYIHHIHLIQRGQNQGVTSRMPGNLKFFMVF